MIFTDKAGSIFREKNPLRHKKKNLQRGDKKGSMEGKVGSYAICKGANPARFGRKQR